MLCARAEIALREVNTAVIEVPVCAHGTIHE
jgi:hypothetical protein